MAQVVLTLFVEGSEPVRVGVPLPESALQRGLQVAKPARLQWRALQRDVDPGTGRRWVELAITGATGRVGVRAGGAGPSPRAGGPVVYYDLEVEEGDAETVHRETWRWVTGETDECVRTQFHVPTLMEGERFEAGEWYSYESPELEARATRVRVDPRDWQRMGVLPRCGRRARRFRDRLIEVGHALVDLPGVRGRGDYGRDEEVVTNLEFDTALGFGRLGLAAEDVVLLRRSLRSAKHTRDRDLDVRSGMPFPHGKGHRKGRPEPGHAWLSGMLLAGCWSADDTLIRAARTMAHALARHPAEGQGKQERARDYGWPLLELEAWIRFSSDPSCVRAADALAAELVRRFDDRAGAIRFGEGEGRDGSYQQRLWLTGGILVPALRAHEARTGDVAVRDVIRQLERRIETLAASGQAGLPIRCWVEDGQVGRPMRLGGVPEGFLLMEGIAPGRLARCLRRSQVVAALDGVPAKGDPRLATTFSMAARCEWVLR